jgi:hypothetical protein
VQLIALQYNWGPPTSGRFDQDFLQLWAAAPALPPSAVFVHGERSDGSWTLDLPLAQLAAFSSPRDVAYHLFGLSLRAQLEFPRQFVLRAERADGHVAYANNHGQNYHLQPYQGRGLSAIRKGLVIYDLGRIVPCQLFRAG